MKKTYFDTPYTKDNFYIFIINLMKLNMNHREITKKYAELLNKAEYANGRKEVVSLLKTAAKLKSRSEI